MSSDPEIIGARDAAEFLGVDYKSALAALERGDLPGIRIGRIWRVSKSALVAHLGMRPDQLSRNDDSRNT